MATMNSRTSNAKRIRAIALILPILLLGGCHKPMSSTRPATIEPPIAARHAHQVTSPNGTREDEYYWLRDDERANPAMLQYLKDENAYTDAVLANTRPLQETLYQEIIGRLKQDDASVPYLENGYWYYSRYETGKDYPIHVRRHGAVDAPEELLLDLNTLAAGHPYYELGELIVSLDGKLLAWTEDTIGRQQYRLRVMEIATRRMLPLERENIESGVVWAADNCTLLYIEKDPETLLGFRVRKHKLGNASGTLATDPVVWEQEDESFYTDVSDTKDHRYLLIHTQSTVSSEIWYADALDPTLTFHLFLPRERDHEYQVDHAGDRWIVRTNWKAKNFRVVEVAHGTEARRDQWRDVIAHRSDALIEGFDVFRDFLAVEERSGGLRKIHIRPWKGNEDRFVTADEASYTTSLDVNREFDLPTVRYQYTSLVTPRTTYDFNALTGERVLLKQEPVLGGYDARQYVTDLVWATARDGTKVPVSLAWRRSTARNGTAPLLQLGYGSYGISNDPDFSMLLPSLLDRGFVIAYAHIRGGQEMGRAWYEDGRQLRKQNSFTDFIDVTRWLVANRYVDRQRVFALGRSAGGLLMGAIANMAPQDYRGIVMGVPFVDVVTTMLDESIPLTTNEFDEWGNPRQKAFYDYMLSYSPYDNIGAHDYPAIYVHSGLWDSQVQYYEPTKYVARLRAHRTGNSLLVLRTNMEAGHGGKSGRFGRYREYAEQYAFLIDQSGIAIL